MRSRIFVSVALVAALGAGLAEARPGERLRNRLLGEMPAPPAVPAAAPQTIAYGSDALQKLDLYQAGGVRNPAPLVLFVHGGGWRRGSKDHAGVAWKAAHLTQSGYAFASIDYRLVPTATVEQQAADVASALKALLDRADTLGIDRTRVVLMGHSAGAHLVALVGTDERYLKAAGLSFADIGGVIPLDGAAYDVTAQFGEGPAIMRPVYSQAFGDDPARQRLLSPTMQAAAPNAPRFLIPHVQREDAVRQSNALAAALKAAGTTAETASFAGEGLRGHMEINRRLGDPAYPATAVVNAWLKQVLGG